MATLKRSIANLIERASGNLVIPPNEVHLGPERFHLRRFLEHFEVDCVFDVGANLGQYATRLRELIGYKGAIISYEPSPEIFRVLAGKAARDGNWHVENLALDREAGPARFNVMVASDFSSLKAPEQNQPEIFDHDNSVKQVVDVMRTTLAVEAAKWQAKLGFKRPFLKMDTQGNDLAVVEGAGSALDLFVGLQSELAIRKLYADSPGLAESLEAYQARGFELSSFVPTGVGHFPRLMEVDCVMFRSALAPARSGAA